MVRRSGFLPLSSIAALIVAGLIPALPAAGADSCAVLPFINRAAKRAEAEKPADANLDWIGVSISETLRDALELRGLVTLSREDLEEAYGRLGLSSRAALTEASVLKIGDTLDAEQVIYGEFEVQDHAEGSHGSVRISAHVVNRRKMRQSPEFEESGSIDDLAALEAHLAWRALNLIAPQLAPPESEFKSLRPAVRLDAEENYIRGLMAADPAQREKFFLEASRLDARFARPDFELGQIHYQRKEYRQAVDWFQKIGPDDLQYRHALFLLGLSLFQSSDFAGAQKAFSSIAQAIPLSEVYNNLGASESRRGMAQAVDDFRKALNGDPNDPDYRFNLGYALWRQGEFAEAAEQFRAALQEMPDDPAATALLGRCLKQQAFRANDPKDARWQGLERIKTAYQERAYRQLKSLLDANPGSAK